MSFSPLCVSINRVFRLWRPLLLSAGLLLAAFAVQARPAEPLLQPGAEIVLDLAGRPDAFAYTSNLLKRSLEREGYRVQVRKGGNIPTTRLEKRLEQGKVSAFILGRTEARDRRFLLVNVGMTDNLVNRRILFIPRGSQADYDGVETLGDFRGLGKVAGLGAAWADRDVWAASELPFRDLDGDWKRLYEMIASQSRNIDYLPRGAQEMAREWYVHRELQVERNLVLVYGQDHVLYVSPEAPGLHAVLQDVMIKAFESGLIAELAADHFKAVFAPPVSLHERRVIKLTPPDHDLTVPD